MSNFHVFHSTLQLICFKNFHLLTHSTTQMCVFVFVFAPILTAA